jgi:hypothetical protein
MDSPADNPVAMKQVKYQEEIVHQGKETAEGLLCS